MIQLGSDVYYFFSKDKKIKKGVVVGLNISEGSGYMLYSILHDDASTVRVEQRHVYAREADAREHMSRVLPLLEQAEEIVATCNRKVDALRLEIIGHPEYPSIIDMINAGKDAPKNAK